VLSEPNFSHNGSQALKPTSDISIMLVRPDDAPFLSGGPHENDKTNSAYCLLLFLPTYFENL
jgi:hypothetical protein